MNPVVKRIITALAVAALVVLAIVYAPTAWLPPAFAVLTALAFLEFALLLRRKVPLLSAKGAFGLVAGFAVLVCGLSALPAAALRDGKYMMLYLIAVVKLSDMGGFAFGLGSKKLFGDNHRLCPSISPAKSWEGLFGSVLGSVLLSLAFVPITHFTWPKAALLGVVAALVGTAGDLAESKYKRWVGVKDSSAMKFTNGLGGVLDMVDSLLFAPAVLLGLVSI